MNGIDLGMNLARTVQRLATAYKPTTDERFDFAKIEWANRVLIADGFSGPTKLRVRLNFIGSPVNVVHHCSICKTGMICPHVKALIVNLSESGVAATIEKQRYAPCRFTLDRARQSAPANPWKSQLNKLVSQFQYSTYQEPEPAKFPAGRELIYVLDSSEYTRDTDALNIKLATRPLDAPKKRTKSAAEPERSDKKASKLYRSFNSGVDAWAASPHPLDREIAERVEMTMPDQSHYYDSRMQGEFTLQVDRSTDLLARLANSGRLFAKTEYALHDDMPQLSWLSDDKFDLKFEVASHDSKHVHLGVCVKNPQMAISYEAMKYVTPRYFLDRQNRLGVFRRPISVDLVRTLGAGKPIVVPRAEAAELISQMMKIPLGLGIEFVGCDDIRPRPLVAQPKPRIHIKSPELSTSDTFEVRVEFDYDGVRLPFGRSLSEFYDKARNVMVQVDVDFHSRSRDLLLASGVKSHQSYDGIRLSLAKKRLPAAVAQLIRGGWHVEADGKLYRTGSKFDLKVSTGIDWFELNGKAHFEQTAIDLPRLLQALQAGQQTVVLDDGTVGLIPEEWIKKFGGLAELGRSEDGQFKFGRSQVGLLDALLAEQGVADVDEKFAAVRESLRAFDRISPQEPPAGFVGELRPYQKLAQGWFEFLRNLGFGGCLADDMGLGKTIQVLSMLEVRRQQKAGPSLIVVPRSLVFNWTAEAKKFAPNLRVLDQSHAQRTRATAHLSDFDVVLSTYGTLRRDAAFLKDFEFDYVILDEAQAIKNATTEAAKAARLLKGRHKLALSGTPIENHLGELWSLFDFLNPGMLGRVGRFAGFAEDADLDQRKFLAASVRPFILRRTKKQVAPELPDRIEQTVVVELESEQRKAYDELREHYRQTLLNKIDSDGIGRSQIVILEALLRLRQAACHPGLIDKARVLDPSAKLDELLTRLTNALEAGERVLVFSQFTSLLAIVKDRLTKAAIQFLYLDGQTKDRQSLVEEFQSGTGPSVFLISLKAGGVGLNLTAARSVILLDPWWNPAVEAQAIDRVHRIGQQQTVFATRLIAADTVEQKVLELQSRKKDLADAIVNADNAGISSLTREDVELLLA